MRVKTKLRIAMIAPDFPLGETINGGVQGVTLYLCQALMRHREIDLKIILPFAPTGEFGSRNVHGLNVHALTTNTSGSFLDPIHYSRLIKVIKQLSPDVVHIQGLAIWSRWCPIPNIVTIHGIAERDVLYQGTFLSSRIKYLVLWLLENTARRKIRNVIAISPYVKNYLGNPRKQNVWDIPNPISDDYFTIEHRPISHRIFSASIMAPRKNVTSLIKAFAEIAAHDSAAELRLAGSGQDTAYGRECRTLVKTVGLEKRVQFLGSLSLKSIRHELSQADCFALCSCQETLPVSVAEAMAAGVPIVASNVGGLPGMIEDGVCGKLVNPMDISSIVQGLERVLFSTDNKNLGVAAKQKAQESYKSSVVAQKTIRAYYQVYGKTIGS